MTKRVLIRRAFTGVLLLITTALWPIAYPTGDTSSNTIDYNQLLRPQAEADQSSAFRFVTGPRPLEFPRDHGPHPDYRLEWWYLTGQLRAKAPNKLPGPWGFQITFFRLGLGDKSTGNSARDNARNSTRDNSRDNAWQQPQLYMAHFAISDVQHQRHIGFERLSRAGAALAGAETSPLRVWLENWSLESQQSEQLFPARLAALATDSDLGTVALKLHIDSHKPPVLQGERGYSPKSATPGNASHYYSYTRLRSQGQLQLGGNTVAVEGDAWLDHEWGSSSLDHNQTGWDWFSLQLDDGRELMFYRLRLQGGATDPFSRGTLVASNGSHRVLMPTDVKLTALAHWQSPSGRSYPLRWQLDVPSEQLSLRIAPLFNDQEWRQRLRYWEGAITVSGSHRGHGYMELSGY